MLLLPSLLLGVAGGWPPQYPPWYVVKTFQQRTDHTNSENHATFTERYLENATHWAGPGKPIIIYTGAEGTGVQDIFTHSGYVMELARELSALVIFAEMRFFGASMPFGKDDSFITNPEHLGLLSIEQALADYAALVEHIKSVRRAQRSPVIAVGGSLAGSLSFWLRAKYPSLVQMALASSAPILGYPGHTSPYGWYEVATKAFEKQMSGCSNRVREGFTRLLAARSAPALSRAFNTCTPIAPSRVNTTRDALVGRLTGSLASMAESAYPKATSPIVDACVAIRGAQGTLGMLAPIIVPKGGCLDLGTISNPVSAAFEVIKQRMPGYLSHARTGMLAAPHDAWYYLACTEIVHPIAANGKTDMFPPQPWSLDGLTAECERLFEVSPRPTWMPTWAGMQRGVEGLSEVASRVIFTNGMLDPWSSQSVTRNASASLIAINIEDGSHHSDLGAPPNPYPSASDSLSLRAARAQQLLLLRTWLAELASEQIMHEADIMLAANTTPPSPPLEPPPPHGGDKNKLVYDIFSGACGGVGLLLLLLGQRAWRVFLALLAFTLSGGASGYVFIHHVHGISQVAAVFISIGVGALFAVLAFCFHVIGLVVFAGVAGLVVAALPMRAFDPTMPPALRVSLIGTASAIALLLTAAATYRCRARRGDEDDVDVQHAPPGTRTVAKLRANTSRKLLEAVVTSTCGAYGIVVCVNQWWDEDGSRSLQLPSLLNTREPLPSCGTPCVVQVSLAAGLLLLGLVVQTSSICKQHKARSDEQRGRTLLEPLSGNSRRNESQLAARMRNKYCGGASATRALMESPSASTAPQPIFAPNPAASAAPPPALGGLSLGQRSPRSSFSGGGGMQPATPPLSAAEQWHAAVEAERAAGR